MRFNDGKVWMISSFFLLEKNFWERRRTDMHCHAISLIALLNAALITLKAVAPGAIAIIRLSPDLQYVYVLSTTA